MNRQTIPFKSLVPLEEIIADALSQNTRTKQVDKEYNNLIDKHGPELNDLLDVVTRLSSNMNIHFSV